MKYFVPDIRLANELPQQERMEEKLGGLPWGLAEKKWPKCIECGKSQTLLAQFMHEDTRLNLGRAGRSLLVFQCNHRPGLCCSWLWGKGANACLVLEPEEIVKEEAALSRDRPPGEVEARIVGWREYEDGLSDAQVEFFSDETKWDALDEEQQESLFSKAVQCTRLGGVPTRIQSSREAPGDAWRFVGQLDFLYYFLTPPKSSDGTERSGGRGLWRRVLDLFRSPPKPAIKTMSPMAQNSRGPVQFTHACEGPNFGDAGMGYIFIRDTAGVPEGLFFWQCS